MSDREEFPNVDYPLNVINQQPDEQVVDRTLSASTHNPQDYIYLSLDSNLHEMEDFIVKYNEPMCNMKRLHLSKLSEKERQSYKVYFVCNAKLISDDDTPQSLGLEDNDIVHVIHTRGEGIRIQRLSTGEVHHLQL